MGTLRAMYKRHEPITLMTASDFPSALIADETDVVLVGDSLSMVSLGRLDTTQVNLEDMIHHCRSVTRGIKTSFVVGDASSRAPLILILPRFAICRWAHTKHHRSKPSDQPFGSSKKVKRKG